MSRHAKLSPSSASRWLRCTKSPEIIQEEEDTGSIYADEGSRAHELLEQTLLQKKFTVPSDCETWPSEYPHIKVTQEMIEAVQVALNFVYGLTTAHPDTVIQTETRVHATSLGGDVYGTADVICHSPRAKKLWVIDYKHGRGVLVSAKDNPQLEIYAIGVLDSFGWLFSGIETVEAVIVQPRCPAPELIRAAVYAYDDLLVIGNRMAAKIKTIGTDEAVFCADINTCRWCPAKANCPTLKDRAVNSLKVDFKDLTKPPGAEKDMSLEFLEQYLKDRALIEAWMSALDVECMTRLSAGEAIGDYKIVAGRSRRKWCLPDVDIAKVLREELKFRPMDIYEDKLVSFTKIEKLIDVSKRNGRAKLDRFQKLTVKPAGKPVVVEGDDPRDPLKPVSFDPLT